MDDLEADLAAALPSPSSLERDVLPGLAGRGLGAVSGSEGLVDIGTPEALAAAGDELGRELTRLELLA